MKHYLAGKSILITLLMPGSGIFVIPYFILRQSGPIQRPDISPSSVLVLMAGLAGLGILLHSIWGFAVHGRGTLAPVDPPKVLVIRGIYRYIRNPMYLGIIMVLISETLIFGSKPLLIYTLVVAFGFHLFVVLYEEPHLRSRFGEVYDEYCKKVPRWLIGRAG